MNSMIKFVLLFSMICFSINFSVKGQSNDLKRNYQFTQINQNRLLNTVSNENIKNVIIGNDSGSIILRPWQSQLDGSIIESRSTLTNKSINTVFYANDSSKWQFYTGNTPRFSIEGNGKTMVNNTLRVGVADDNQSTFQVSGSTRLDSSVYFKSLIDSKSFISIHRNVKGILDEPDDGISPYVTTPTAWILNQNLPAIRIRHPRNTSGKIWNSESIERDLIIAPYEYGMAIEYNGVVECWVGEWSIHKGVFYNDVEGKGNGFGAVLWVGDDQDVGGVRATARNNFFLGGNVRYGELSVERFTGLPHGDFRLRLPSTDNSFQFVYGERGSNNVIAKLNHLGFVLPTTPSIDSITLPEKAQLVFDSTLKMFKGYNGTEWKSIGDSPFLTGTFITSGNGISTSFLIPHGQNKTPKYYQVQATSPNAGDHLYVSANSTHLIVHYKLAPAVGNNNLSYNWLIER